MPTYDYKCDDCGHEFEAYQSMKDEKLTVCPNCGKSALRRLIGSGSGLIFKGSGFYLTDYKNKPSETKTSASPSSEAKKSEPTASTDAPKTESKPAAETSSTKEAKETKSNPDKK